MMYKSISLIAVATLLVGDGSAFPASTTKNPVSIFSRNGNCKALTTCEDGDSGALKIRDLATWLDDEPSDLVVRTDTKPIMWCDKLVRTKQYPGPSDVINDQSKWCNKNCPVYGFADPNSCKNIEFGKQPLPDDKTKSRYQVEHVLEGQLVNIFSQRLNTDKAHPSHKDPKTKNNVDFCTYTLEWLNNLPPDDRVEKVNGKELKKPDSDGNSGLRWLASVFPQDFEQDKEEFALLASGVNRAKESLWQGHSPIGLNPLIKLSQGKNGNNWLGGKELEKNYEKVIASFKKLIGLRAYHRDDWVEKTLKKQSDRMADMLEGLEEEFEKKGDFTDTSSTNWEKYEKQGLKTKWNSFMKTQTESAINKIDEDMGKAWGTIEKARTEFKTKITNGDKKKEKDLIEALEKIVCTIDSVETVYNKEKAAAKMKNPF